jgi:iron complex transport system permease protein
VRRAAIIWSLLALATLGAGAISLSLGSAPHDPIESWRALLDPGNAAHAVMVRLRLPRVLNGYAVGALLALAGAVLQVLLRNPLAEPYILGLSGGASLGALAALILGLSASLVTGCAALGAGASLMILVVLARREFSAPHSDGASERLLLSGVMLAALWGASITLVLSLSSENRIQALIFWLMGDLGGVNASSLAWVILAVCFCATMADARRLNLLAHGDDWAATLGVDVGALKLRAVAVTALAAGGAVALAGPIGFVGLVAPHLMRVVVGNDQRLLLPCAAMAGAMLVTIADALARTVLAPQQLPVGALTAVLGAPLFLVLLWRSQR